MKAVFTTKAESHYDDLPEQRYHFPRTYLRQVQNSVGDWIVYYEPRRPTQDLMSVGGRQAYFAVARVAGIKEDPLKADHFYATIDQFLQFTDPVPFREGRTYFENILRRDDGKTNRGAFGRAVRNMSDDEFDAIVTSGFSQTDAMPSRLTAIEGFMEDLTPFQRPIVERIVQRPFRDAAFAASIKRAYDDTCAMTGLKIINGGGRAEVQAAHIRPVARQGTDSIRNGVALSGTMHWMFDRGLVSIDDDFSILIARDKVPDTIGRLLVEDKKLLLPRRPDIRPHSGYLDFHRKHIFKG